MDVLETQRSSSFINADEREPQLSNTSRPISTQSRIGKNTQCRKRNDKTNIYNYIVHSYFHDVALEF